MAITVMKNAFLIESLQGIRSVKSLALDARHRHEWDVRVAEAARRRLAEGRTANVIQTVVTPLERMMVSGIFALSVYLAIATNVFLYYDVLEQALAMSNVEAMLKPGAFLLANFSAPALTSLTIRPIETTETVYAPARGVDERLIDFIVLYKAHAN